MLKKSWSEQDRDGYECLFTPTGEELTYCGCAATTIDVTRFDDEGTGWNCGSLFVARYASRAQVEQQFFYDPRVADSGLYSDRV